MGGFLLIISLIIATLFTIWILPRILSWLFERKYKICLKISRISLPYLKLCNILISSNGFSIHIDEISIKSSFLNSELTKLITLVVRDVRINKDINNLASDDKSGEIIDFRDYKIPYFINTFAQFMAVHIYNISAMLLRSDTPGCLIHSTASELHLDGSILKNAKSLLVTLNLMEATSKVLTHAEKINETCLAEFSFGIFMEAILVAQGPLSVEKLNINMSQTSAIINDAFYNLLSNNDNRKKIVHDNVDHIEMDDDIFHRLLPIIPKNLSFVIDDTSLKGVRENSQIEYNSFLKTFILSYKSSNSDDKYDADSANAVSFKFYISDLLLQNSREKLLTLKFLNTEAKIKNYIANIYFQLNNLSLTYNHDVIHHWIYTNFLKNKSLKIASSDKRDKLVFSGARSNSFIEKMVKKYTINMCAAFTQVSAIIKLNEHNHSCLGFTRIRLMLEQAQESRGALYDSDFLKLLLNDRHWQVEFLIESFRWSFKECSQDVSKKMHIWGTPMYLGMVLIKFCAGNNSEIKVDALLDTIHWEWSLELADCVLLAIKCFKQYQFKSTKKALQLQKTPIYHKIYLNVVITQFNCFFQSQNTEYFVFRLNTITIDRNLSWTNIQFKEFKIFSLNNTGAYYSCIRSEDISNFKIFIKTAHVEMLKENSQTDFNINLDEITVYWSTNFHLKSLLLARDINDFLTGVKEELNFSQIEPKSSKIAYNCTVLGLFAFYIEISEKHFAQISLNYLNFSTNCDDTLLKNDGALISIDGSEIFNLKGFSLHRIKDHEMIRAERLDNENFQLRWNKTWNVSVDLFKAVFPYEHNYAEAVQNEFISIFKWLKIVHNKKKTPFTASSPLPSDLLINVRFYRYYPICFFTKRAIKFIRRKINKDLFYI